MALNLNHFQLAEDPNLFYRRVGMPAVDDFLIRGQIAGSENYGGQAYFLRGAEWSTGKAPYRITANMSMLNPAENPLYGNLGFNRYLSQEGVFPIGRTAMSSGQYPILTPNTTPSFWDIINPMNRSGIKIDDSRTGKVIYDRLKPITQTPIGTTLKNVGVEARIAGNLISDAAGPIALKAGGTAGFLLDVPEQMAIANKRRREKNGPVEATPSEVAAMLGISTAKSIANAVTLGAALSGTGKNRPKRGLSEMEASSTEMYRRMTERAKNWIPE